MVLGKFILLTLFSAVTLEAFESKYDKHAVKAIVRLQKSMTQKSMMGGDVPQNMFDKIKNGAEFVVSHLPSRDQIADRLKSFAARVNSGLQSLKKDNKVAPSSESSSAKGPDRSSASKTIAISARSGADVGVGLVLPAAEKGKRGSTEVAPGVKVKKTMTFAENHEVCICVRIYACCDVQSLRATLVMTSLFH